ncbi:MAG: hypothetical protein M1834_007050 [Cirrosporium novae-zelandiae]|nr:MAG: hypothetical protein M1834_007050 [Cirrosporium novae-zelandiae]
MTATTDSKYIFAPSADGTTGQAEQYTKASLEISQLSPSPFVQFNTWFQQAEDSGIPAPEALTLSTAELPSGKISARLVLLKELDEKGFVIYSNWGTSRKAKDIISNPYAALTFWWAPMERQIRVEGPVERLSREESQIYFDTRARGSRIGAYASQQSTVIQSREELDKRYEEVEKRFEGQEKIPVPEHWGGLRVLPEMVEFWQGRNSRLHDRFQYRREGEGAWRVDRVAP